MQLKAHLECRLTLKLVNIGWIFNGIFIQTLINRFYFTIVVCKDYIYRKKDIDKTNIESIENYALYLEAKLEEKGIYDVTFKCRNDFSLQGPNQARCFQNGSWSREIPRCLEQCADLVKHIENIQASKKRRSLISKIIECSMILFRTTNS
ncbi:Hypothetical predicted protein [Mytilus galloprovincialis]|uniref:Sushi domain-containing protein n=1 Tax=Mytilus galloprovincialis TaxID=29158 RepID=A0A8B6EDX6_MYTGA|nr:Hypothetical predicted protein [Mytilus galloprovincialis]